MKVLLLWAVLSLWIGACRVQAAAVFAHFMVTNSENFTTYDWEINMKSAQQAHIDAFALNMAYGDPTNEPSLGQAFDAANITSFQLFFSFDYAGNGAWPRSTVIIDYLTQYGSNSAYYHYNGKPLVSTFEGAASAADWIDIKTETGCYFVPDWSSPGAKAALEASPGVPDGLFSWAAWLWGPNDMDTHVDASYMQYLDGKPYMMPVSPWFYTNLPGYKKNWLWNGDHLWYERWEQVLDLQPEWVEIISWNDYGESHYIGPMHANAMAAFEIDNAPYNYVMAYMHEGWQDFLPYVIDLYKTGTATITQEGVQVWYRRAPGAACTNAGTSGNTASQFQVKFPPTEVLKDEYRRRGARGRGNTYTVGESKAVVAQADGSHLIYNDPPNGLFPYRRKRDLAGSSDQHQEDEDSAPLADADLLHEPALNATIRLDDFLLPATTPNNNLRRPAALPGTSFLDSRVYTDVLSSRRQRQRRPRQQPQQEPPTDSTGYPATYQIYMRPGPGARLLTNRRMRLRMGSASRPTASPRPRLGARRATGREPEASSTVPPAAWTLICRLASTGIEV
ncbi:mutanase Pc12g07500 [Aspergillus lentulus]|uniref:Mutanase Pc12g07500 n=1 Tax=Aspergillus lentulus TaxID=293939 RepID=A0AAN4PKR9_ASPLE|nr:mutanase Pc12g07500 [Aspergillus lentulus]